MISRHPADRAHFRQPACGKVATDEHTFDQFVEEQALRLDEGMYTVSWSSLRG